MSDSGIPYDQLPIGVEVSTRAGRLCVWCVIEILSREK